MSDQRIICAIFKALPGQADRLRKIFADVRTVCDSDQEPGCLAFRTTQLDDTFALFEVYANDEAVEIHQQNPKFLFLLSEAGKGDLLAEAPIVVKGAKEFFGSAGQTA